MTMTGPSKPAGRFLRIALVVSLALNVLFVGGIASAFFLSPKGHYGHRGSILTSFARTLPQERGDFIRTRIAGGKAALAPLRQAERDARQAARAILLEEPFDKDKFKAALDRAVDADAAEKRGRMSLFADINGELTPAERKQLHDWLEKRRPLNSPRDEPKPD